MTRFTCGVKEYEMYGTTDGTFTLGKNVGYRCCKYWDYVCRY